MCKGLQHIHAVGVEIEGIWTLDDKDAAGSQWHDDSSVEFDSIDDDDEYLPGEIVSPKLYSTAEIKQFLQEFQPVAVNSTCGMHVHVSLEDASLLDKLTNTKFVSWVESKLDSLQISPTQAERIAGSNYYCCRLSHAMANGCDHGHRRNWLCKHECDDDCQLNNCDHNCLTLTNMKNARYGYQSCLTRLETCNHESSYDCDSDCYAIKCIHECGHDCYYCDHDHMEGECFEYISSHHPDLQIKGDGSRYSQINFSNLCPGGKGTIEFRVWAASSKLSDRYKMIINTINWVNEYINLALDRPVEDLNDHWDAVCSESSLEIKTVNTLEREVSEICA